MIGGELDPRYLEDRNHAGSLLQCVLSLHGARGSCAQQNFDGRVREEGRTCSAWMGLNAAFGLWAPGLLSSPWADLSGRSPDSIAPLANAAHGFQNCRHYPSQYAKENSVPWLVVPPFHNLVLS